MTIFEYSPRKLPMTQVQKYSKILIPLLICIIEKFVLLVLGIKKSVQILKPRKCCRAKLSAEDVCRTENFLYKLDNISSSY